MSNTDKGGSMEGPRSQTAPVSDPASAANIHAFGIGFLIFAIFVFCVLVTTWPVLEQGSSSHAPAFKAFRFFGFGPYNWAPDLRMLLTVIIAGTIGSLIHTLTSFGDYVGNRRLSTSWMWWFVLRTPIGIALAIVSYLILRGGLIVPTLQAPKDGDLQGGHRAAESLRRSCICGVGGHVLEAGNRQTARGLRNRIHRAEGGTS